MTIYLFALTPTVVMRALVNMPDPYTFPTTNLIYDTVSFGSADAVLPGSTLLIGSAPGLDDYGRNRVGEMHPDYMRVGFYSWGNRDGELMPVDNAFITIWDDHRVWAKIPRLQESGFQFKDGIIDPIGNPLDGGVDFPPPCANGGPGFANTINPATGKITVAFDAINSFYFQDASYGSIVGATIVQWDVGDGTITVGNSTSRQITATFPPGFRWVALTVTRSDDTAQHTAYIPVFARDPANDLTIKHQIVNHRITPQGQTLSLRILQPFPRATYPDGTLLMLWEEDNPRFASILPDTRFHMLFIGWHQTDEQSRQQERTATISEMTIEALDVAGRLATLPGFPQRLEKAIPPYDWYNTKYPTILYYLHYLLHWHSTALEVADLRMQGAILTLYTFLTYASEKDSLYGQAEQLCQAITPDHHLTCTRQGELYVVPDPMLMPVSDRTSMVGVEDSFDESKWTEISIEDTRPLRINFLLSGALLTVTDYVIVDGNPTVPTIWCRAPGRGRGQGLGEMELTDRIADDQGRLNTAEGHRYARLNSPYGRVTIRVPYDKAVVNFGPANMRWVNLDLTVQAGFPPWVRGFEDSFVRSLAQEVTVTYDYGRTALVRTLQITLEIETQGQPAATWVRPL